MAVENVSAVLRSELQRTSAGLQVLGDPALRHLNRRGNPPFLGTRHQLRPLVGQCKRTARLEAQEGSVRLQSPDKLRNLLANQLACPAEIALADHGPAATDQACQLNTMNRLLQHTNRRSADLRLVIRREAIV